MKRRFVVAIDGLTDAQENQVSELFLEKYGWWHWIDGFWLLVDSTDELTPASIRGMIGTVKPTARRIVLEVLEVSGQTSSWAGYGPTGDDHTMFKWLRETWKG